MKHGRPSKEENDEYYCDLLERKPHMGRIIVKTRYRETTYEAANQNSEKASQVNVIPL